ncbi:MAG: substrate-binding domain-containing protein [Hymenobacteraceae bacterium]|nr:substrate-binding domain-containing protein [Hymenobacteraceae bacterium]
MLPLIHITRFTRPAAVGGALLALGALTGCPETKNGKLLDTPTSGSIQIAVDETLQPILAAHIDSFQGLYPAAKVRASYAPETKAMAAFMASDSVRVVVSTRRLTPEEEAELVKQQIIPVQTRIAVDGVAVILHPSNPDSLLSVAQVAELCDGTITQWGQLNPENKLGAATVVFDNSASSTRRYVRDSVLSGQQVAATAFATKTHEELIEYVAAHPGAIGFIGVNWISDQDDAAVRGFLKKVRVAALTTKRGGATAADFVKPYQANVALWRIRRAPYYPLCRELYVISREGRAGLGTGFASFVAGDKGQRIFLKAGLVPATVPVRIVQTADDRPAPTQ